MGTKTPFWRSGRAFPASTVVDVVLRNRPSRGPTKKKPHTLVLRRFNQNIEITGDSLSKLFRDATLWAK
jgi:hypothetical protein